VKWHHGQQGDLRKNSGSKHDWGSHIEDKIKGDKPTKIFVGMVTMMTIQQ
jgi:hypothetical protein